MPLPPKKIKSLLSCVVLLILISLLTYFNSLKGSFQFDDIPLIKSDWLVNIQAFFDHPRSGQIGNRPVVYWTYALNNQLAIHQVFGFHLINLALHIGVTLLIFFILWRTRYLQNKFDWLFPLTAALLFSLHPLNTDSVSYISSRSSLLATFFYLLALYFFLNLFCHKKKSRFATKLILSLLVVSGIYFSIASKLIGATLPVMLTIWYWSFIGRKQYPFFHKAITNNRSVFIGLTIVAIISILIIIFSDRWIYMPLDQGLQLFGRTPYLMIQLKVIIFYYLKLFYFPFNLNVDIGFPFSSSITDPTIIFSGIIIITIILANLKWRNVWVVFGTIWFFITLAPTSSFVPLNDLAVEHRIYLPMSLGLSLIAGVGIKNLPALLRLPLLLAVLIALGATTANRNADWVNALNLWEDSAKKNPFSPRPHNNVGEAYYKKGNLEKATYHFEKSVSNIPIFMTNQYNLQNSNLFLRKKNKFIESVDKNILKSARSFKIDAEVVEPHYNLATVYLDQGRLDEAEKEYQKVQVIRPDHFPSKIGLSSVYNQKGLYGQALSLLEQAVKENISNPSLIFALARSNLGELYGKTGRIEDAIIEWESALKIDPSLLPAHFNLGTAYMMLEKLDPAKNAFKHCLKLNSQHKPALFNLAKVYQMQKQWSESTQQFKLFLKISGPRASAYTQIGFNFNKQLDWGNAQTFLEKSIALQPYNVNARIYLAEALIALGEKENARKNLQAISSANSTQKTMISTMMLNLNNPANMTP